MLLFKSFILIMVRNMYYINLFFVYSILGFIFENTLVRLIASNYESGILFGPWTPVYGIGVLVIVIIYKWLKRHINREWVRSLLLFFLSAVTLSILEFIGGELIENIFGKIFWNYEHFKYNIGKYVSLETAAIWGVFSLFIIYLIKKFVDKIIKLIPKWLTYLSLGLFFFDALITLILK